MPHASGTGSSLTPVPQPRLSSTPVPRPTASYLLHQMPVPTYTSISVLYPFPDSLKSLLAKTCQNSRLDSALGFVWDPIGREQSWPPCCADAVFTAQVETLPLEQKSHLCPSFPTSAHVNQSAELDLGETLISLSGRHKDSIEGCCWSGGGISECLTFF